MITLSVVCCVLIIEYALYFTKRYFFPLNSFAGRHGRDHYLFRIAHFLLQISRFLAQIVNSYHVACFLVAPTWRKWRTLMKAEWWIVNQDMTCENFRRWPTPGFTFCIPLSWASRSASLLTVHVQPPNNPTKIETPCIYSPPSGVCLIISENRCRTPVLRL